MSKVKTSALLLMMLLTVTASIVIVSAEPTKKSKIKFSTLATGECFVGFTISTPIPVPPYYEIEVLFDGLGRGIAEINGSAKAVPVPYTEYTKWFIDRLEDDDVCVAEKVKASGSATVSWIDDNEIRHWLFVSIYETKPYPYPCIFSPKTDYFWMPMPGPEPPSLMQLLRFDAIHVSGSDSEVISGMALFAVMPFPFTPYDEPPVPLHDPAVVIFLVWMDEEVGIQYQYSLFWSSITGEITDLMPFAPFDITAATVFNSNVEVTKAH